VRADRLVAVLLLLQQRGQVTAKEVAAELEVSERTARRDLEALGLAGLPIYSVQGRGGGWRLAGDGRTDLSGLSAAEVQALFVLAGPQAATPQVRAALRKLVRALPEPLRPAAEAASTRVLVDAAGWDRPTGTRPPPPFLDVVQGAVVDGRQLQLGYRARDGAASDRVVEPLGVAAKGTTWYLFADTDAGQRAFRVDRITSVEPTGAPATRPSDFDLAEVWARFVDQVDHLRTPIVAHALAHPDMVRPLRAVLGTRVGIGPTQSDGRVAVDLRGHTARSLATEVAGFGALVEVLDPPELRIALAEIGTELAATYS
jgi:predicted DNA-binding transcriptional regulator YafY